MCKQKRFEKGEVMATKIDYVDETWNPVIGCTKCSPGCDNCYAEKMAWRMSDGASLPYALKEAAERFLAETVAHDPSEGVK